ncbi:ATP-dependent RNA helicase HrpA [Halochromatium salexigens]|uniref:ATP-dependent RNA helicase HrpA n=1 Tax=Halochromatium salexigens TaxID=49447 RepID=UPI003B82CAFE
MDSRRRAALDAIGQCLLKDRRRLKRLLKRLPAGGDQAPPEQGTHRAEQQGAHRSKQQAARQGTPQADAWLALRRAIEQSRAIVDARRTAVPAQIHFPPELPVSERRDEVAALLRAHQVIVLCGETGSGKSTQLPKLCLELGRGVFGRIGHTQPRRIAARSLASRVATELGTELGNTVGYKVRFHDRVRPETSVKLMTDGILLAEIQRDRYLNEYDTLIIDEAHERSLNIDFLLGYLKQLLPKRPDLKLIITSATIDPQRFSKHFAADGRTGDGADDGKAAPIIEISGRTYPVEVRYRLPEEEHAGERDDAMQQAISSAVGELARVGPGDVLVFLSGEREIRETAETLRKQHPPSTEVLPLFARQGPAEQARVFQPHGRRRVVLATNVAETSLTVPGIHYVVDPGFARISRYSHRSKVQRLPVERISQASADQRKGRCGRVASGVCIRLYDEDNFAARAEHTEPEIRRSNLAAVILQMKQLGFGEIERFPFVDPPDSRLISDGYRTLEELAAIDAEGQLTTIGKQLARLPVDPRIGRMLLAGAEHHCLRELTIIASALAVQDPRERPLEQQQAADEIHATFRHPDSDFLSFLNLWAFLETERRHLTRRKFQRLCKQHFLSWTRVQEWRDTQIQLHELMAEMGYRDRLGGDQGENANKNAGKNPDKTLSRHQAEGTYEEVHRALLTGLLSIIGRKDEQREYQGARGGRFYIHPSSALFALTPKWIVCAERVETTRDYGRICAKVQPAWIERAGSHLLKRSYSEPHWQSRAGQVAAFETITLYGLTLFSRRRINYGPINPAEAREVFLRAALVEGDFETRAPFWRHNQALIEEVHQLEAKSRRRDILVDEEGIYAFYDERVPSGIYSKPQFERWLRKATRTTPKLLHMDLEQVMQHDARAITAEQYPNHLRIGATELPLEYHFEPGQEADGVTLVLPQLLINQVSPERLQWLVPGLLTERITAMLRGLPKTLRRAFVPVPDTAARVAARLTPSDRPLVRAVAEELKALTGEQVPEDAWDDSALPPYLRMKVRLVDTEGRTLALDDDLLRLKRRHASSDLGGDLGERSEDRRDGRASPGLGATLWNHPIERDGLKRWDFGDLPEHLDLDRAGIRLRGWPALVDQGDAVAVRVLDSEQSAALAMRAGLRRLIMLTLGAELRVLRRGLCETAGGLDRMRLLYAKAAQPPASATLASVTPAAATSATALAVSDQAAAAKRTTNGPKRGKKKRKGGGKGSAGAASGAAGTALAGVDLVDELLALILDLTFTEGQPPIRDQASFDQRLSANQPRLFSVAQEVCALATTILGTYQAARKRLDGITQVQWMPSVLDMRAHLDALVYRGFFVQVPFGHLQDYPRYLRALEQRAEKLPLAATRDRERMQALAPLVERWRERSSAAESAEREDERLEEIRWMLEELRVSLFAQQLGTAYPVSVKRIERRWQELGL